MEKEYEFFESPIPIHGEHFFKLDCVEEVCSRFPINDIFAIAYLLTPDFVRVKDYIFVADFLNRYGEKTMSPSQHLKKVERLEKLYKGDRTKIEKAVNSWSIVDLFCLYSDGLVLTDEILCQFCDILVEHWRFRVKALFPDRDIVVDSGYEIMGELGLTITVYQRDKGN